MLCTALCAVRALANGSCRCAAPVANPHARHRLERPLRAGGTYSPAESHPTRRRENGYHFPRRELLCVSPRPSFISSPSAASASIARHPTGSSTPPVAARSYVQVPGLRPLACAAIATDRCRFYGSCRERVFPGDRADSLVS